METKAHNKPSHSFRTAGRGESDLLTCSQNSTRWEVTDWLIPVVFPLPIEMKSVARNPGVVSLTTRRNAQLRCTWLFRWIFNSSETMSCPTRTQINVAWGVQPNGEQHLCSRANLSWAWNLPWKKTLKRATSLEILLLFNMVDYLLCYFIAFRWEISRDGRCFHERDRYI